MRKVKKYLSVLLCLALLIQGNITLGFINVVQAEVTDTQAPTAPTALTSTSITSTAVDLNWTASTDDVAVTGYDIYNGATLAGTTTEATIYSISNLTPNTAYSFTIKAKDAAGNISDSSAELSISTLNDSDTTPPSVPTSLVSTSIMSTTVDLSWTASTDNVAVTGYDIYNGATLTGSTTGAITYSVADLTPNTAYSFSIKAKDAAGNISDSSSVLSVTTLDNSDTTPPSTPTGLVSTSITSTTVDLSWTTSTDNVSVTGYDIYNGTTLIRSTTGATICTLTGLIPNTAYSFTIKARDAAGNISDSSEALSLTTLNNVTNVSGTISQNTTWTAANSPYVLQGSITIPSGVTLTLQPGVIVKTSIYSYSINLQGNLNALGTSDCPIVFTAYKDAAYGGSGVSTSYLDYWAGINVKSTGAFNGDNVKIKYGAANGLNMNSSLYSEGKLTLTNSEVSNSYGYGIFITKAGDLSITGNNIIDNKGYPIYVYLGSVTSPISGILNNIYRGNMQNGVSSDGIALYGTPIIDLTLSRGNYLLAGDITIPSALTLTIQPGSIVKGFSSWTNKINVQGNLKALGTTDSPIVFTANKDAEYGGSGVSSSSDYWQGINVSSTGAFTGDNIKIKYGAANNGNNYSELLVQGKLSLTNSQVSNSFAYGIYVSNTGDLNITGNNIINNGGYPIYVNLNGVKSSISGIQNNNFTGNTQGGVSSNGIALNGNYPTIDLTLSRGNYLLTSNLNVPSGLTFTIQPGVIIKSFTSWVNVINVQGNLNALGTSDSPIVFTTEKDAAFGGSGVSSSPNDYWQGICVKNTGTFTGDNVKIKYGAAYRANYNSSLCVQGKLTLTNSEVSNSYGYSAYLDTTIQPVLVCNTFTKNKDGMYNNKSSSMTLDAKYNFWGSYYGPSVYDNVLMKWFGNGDKVYAGIDYIPWLGSEMNYQFHFGQNGTYSASGNFSRTYSDMKVKSPGFDINIGRTYNSRNDKTTLLSKGWTFGYEGQIKDAESTATQSDGTIKTAIIPTVKVVYLPDGSVQTFTVNDDGTFTANDSRSSLVKQNGVYVLTTKNQCEYYFDTHNYLVKIQDKSGNAVSITLDANGKISDITDQVGRHFTIAYENGFIKTIHDEAGNRTVSYEYENNRLVRVIDPMGIVTHYSYDSYGFLNEVKDNNLKLTESISYIHDAGDNKDKVSATTDSYGNVHNYNYDKVNHKTTIVDSNGRQTTEVFDSSLNIISTIDPEGKTVSVDYNTDANGVNKFSEQNSRTDRNGNKTTNIRDGNGNITKVTNPDGSFRQLFYDSKNNLIREIDENGKNTFYIYDSNMVNLLKIAKPLNGTDDYTTPTHDDSYFSITQYSYYAPGENGYTAKGLIKTLTKPEGGITSYTYDSYGNIHTETYSENNTTTNTYNNISLKISSISPLQYSTIYIYDKNGNLEKQVLNGGETSRTTYDNLGRKVMEISPNQYNPTKDDLANHSYNDDCGTRYTYYDNGLIKTKTDAENNTTSYTYDMYGKVATETRPNNSIITNNYDVMERLSRVYFQENAEATPILQEEYSYTVLANHNTQKNMIKYLNSTDQGLTVYTYNYAEKQISQKDPDNTTTSTTYNANGTIQTTIDPNGSTTTYIYDGLNRCIEKDIPFEVVNGTTYYTIQKKSYDKNDNLVDVKISNNLPGGTVSFSEKSNVYNERDQLEQVALYNNGTPVNYTQYYYDQEGKMVRMYTGLSSPLTITGLDSVTPTGDSDYETTKFENNYLGKLTKMTDSLANFETYSYDSNGNMLQKIDRNGNTTINTYDNLDRVTNNKVTTTSGTGNSENTYTYDTLGNRESVVSGGTSITYGYDGKGRMITENDPNGIEKTYTYDYTDNRKTFILKQNGTIAQSLSYNYDIKGRLIQVLDNGQVSANYTYDANGNRLSLTLGNNNTTYSYNLANRVKTLTNNNGSIILSKYTYTYNTDGKQVSKADNANNVTAYTFDGLGRLTTENVTQNGTLLTNTAYTYDDYSNIQSKDITGEGASTTNYNYDLNNRLLSETNTISGTTNYVYDDNGNTVTTTVNGTVKTSNTYNGLNMLTSSDVQGVKADYTYDADGLRSSKAVEGSEVTTYAWDMGDITAELSGSTPTINTTYVRGINLLTKKDASGTTLYDYLFNGHGDVVQLTGSNGSVVKTYDYDAFGNEKTPDQNDTNTFRYSGEYFDKETGNYYLRARYYNPANGRFISEDSYTGQANDPLSLNLYTYCEGDPVDFSDPSGHWIVDALFALADAKQFIQAPTLANAGWLALDLVSFLDPTGLASTAAHAVKAVKAVKAVNAAKDVIQVAHNSDAAIYTVKSVKEFEGVANKIADRVNGVSKGAGEATSKGWKVGDDIYKPTAKGNEPAWNTVKSRFWKNESAKSGAVDQYGADNVERMRKGNATQRYNPDKGGMESMELSHEPIPQRDGGTNFVPRWPQDHAGVDPYRRPGY